MKSLLPWFRGNRLLLLSLLVCGLLTVFASRGAEEFALATLAPDAEEGAEGQAAWSF